MRSVESRLFLFIFSSFLGPLPLTQCTWLKDGCHSPGILSTGQEEEEGVIMGQREGREKDLPQGLSLFIQNRHFLRKAPEDILGAIGWNWILGPKERGKL